MKRALFIISYFVVYIVIESFNWLFLFLDELFYPSYRRIAVKAPVFIIGMPRTGSSFLHNLLTADKKRFTTMKLWESLLCPSIIQKRIALYIYYSKAFRYLSLHSLLRKTDRYLFRNFFPLHPTGLFSVEEDDSVLLPVLASQTLVYLLPECKYFSKLVFFDEKFGERRKKMIMRYYKRAIQRHLFVFGQDKTYLTKSPYFTSRMQSLMQTFPGVRFICLTREPEQAVPSAVALLARLSMIYRATNDIRIIRDRVLLAADCWYFYPLRVFSGAPDLHPIVIDFKDLVTFPGSVVERILDQFGFSADGGITQEVSDEIRKAPEYRSGQVHSLEKYMLDADAIRSRYQDTYQDLIKLSAYGIRQKKDVPLSLVKDG